MLGTGKNGDLGKWALWDRYRNWGKWAVEAMGTWGKWAPEKMDTRATEHLGQMSIRAKLEQMSTLAQMGILGINRHVGDWEKWRFGEMDTLGK